MSPRTVCVGLLVGLSCGACRPIQFEVQRNETAPFSQSARLMVVRCEASACATRAHEGGVSTFVPVARTSTPCADGWYDPWYQVAWCASTAAHLGEGEIFLSLDEAIDDPKTVVEVLTVPLSAYNLHGAYGQRQGRWWIYLAVTVALATIYVAVSRARLWQALLTYAIAAFAAVGAENVTNAVVALRLLPTTPPETAAVAIAVASIGANLLPAVGAALVMRFGRCDAVGWAVAGVVVGGASLCMAGAGWFLGPGLLVAGSALRVMQQRC